MRARFEVHDRDIRSLGTQTLSVSEYAINSGHRARPSLDPRWVKKAINIRFYPNKIAMKSGELN